MERLEINKIMNVTEHTLLKPYTKEKEIRKFIDEASALKVYGICINPLFAKSARRYITKKGYPLKITVTIDFPMGVLTTNARAKILKSIAKDVNEADFVVQLGYVKSKKFNAVQKDVNKLVDVAHQNNIIIKFIVEDAYTTKEEKEKLYEIVCSSKADFIKTSTGFAEPEYTSSIGNRIGADPENVRLMANTIKRLGSKTGIKVSGGIHSYQQVLDLLNASEKTLNPQEFRIGTSGTKKLYEEMENLKTN